MQLIGLAVEVAVTFTFVLKIIDDPKINWAGMKKVFRSIYREVALGASTRSAVPYADTSY